MKLKLHSILLFILAVTFIIIGIFLLFQLGNTVDLVTSNTSSIIAYGYGA